jgi:hypothetical protein
VSPTLSRVTVAVWLLATLALIAWRADRGLQIDGSMEGLVPVADRAPRDEPWLLVTPAPEQGAPTTAPQEDLLAAGLVLAEAFGDERVPLAPPANAVTGWLDAHGLYLLPIERHAELAALLEDGRIAAAIQGLVARLGSPLFGVGSEEPRRDPLGLQGVLGRDGARLGHGAARHGTAAVTGTGDLLSARGDALLVQLRSTRPPAELAQTARAAVAELPVEVAVLGPAAREQAVAERLAPAAVGALAAVTAALALVLTLALRRIRPVLCLLAVLAGGVVLVESLAPTLDPLSSPLVVLMPAFCCGAALRLQDISRRGWAAAVLIATGLAPLALSPYPQWRTWAAAWGLGALSIVLLVRIVTPALLRTVGGSVEWRTPGFLLLPMPVLGLGLTLGLSAAGAWAGGSLRHADVNRPGMVPAGQDAAAERVARDFFDPAQIVEARSRGPTRAGALEQAAVDARALATLVDAQAVRVDSPGSYVTPHAELEARMRSLTELELHRKMRRLHDALEAQGLRAEAFAEFLHGATNLHEIPTARAALDEALGPWIARHLVEDPQAPEPERWIVRSFVELRPGPTVPAIADADGQGIALRGPAVASRSDAAAFRDRVGVYIAAGLWLGAFVVWLGTGSLAIALAAGVAGFTTQTGTLLALSVTGQPVGPHLLPALLLVGISGLIAAGRACRAVDLHRPLVAGGMLTTGLCQAGAGLVLSLGDVEIWREMGLVVLVGSVLAVGLGLFAAPGMCALLRRAAGHRPAAPPASGGDSE